MLDPDEPGVRPLAGGTALMLLTRSGLFDPRRLVSLRDVAGLTGIEDEAGRVVIGAMTTLRGLERSPDVAGRFPALAQALAGLANVRVRNVATVGGHLAHADPHLDLPPVLMVLGASLLAVGPGGEREVRIEALITGYYETSLAPDELIASVRIPVPGPGARSSYVKFCARSVEDWPAVGVAAAWRHEEARLMDVRLAVGAIGARPTRLPEAEEVLSGRAPTAALLDEAARAAAGAADPVPDENGSAGFKREMVRVHVRRALTPALDG